MKANRSIYLSFDYMIIVTLLVCISIEFVSLFLDNEIFSFGAKVSIIFGLLLLIVCVKRSVGGYPFKIFTLFLILYFVQRIILLSINPDPFVYPIDVNEYDINYALLYLFCSIIVILLGFIIGIVLSSMKKSKGRSDLNYGIFKANSYRDKWIKISYVLLFANYFVLFYFRHGYGVLPPEEYAWVFRPLRALGIMFLGNVFLLVQSHIKLSDYEKKTLKIFIVLYVVSIIISGSRAALFMIPVAVVVVKFIIGDTRIRAKTLILLSLIIPLLAVYVVFINFYRTFLQESFVDPSVSVTSIIDYNSLLNKISLTDVLDFFSMRMNGFDLLVGALKKQDLLSSYINIKYQLVTLIDSLYPGSLFEHGMDPGLVIPLILRDIDMSTYVLSKEHMHLIGMSSVYFGYWGGLIFLFIFFFIVALILFSKGDIIIKLIITNILIIYTFETGFIDGIFQNLSETLIMYGLVVIFTLNFRSTLHVITKSNKTAASVKTGV